MGWERVMWVFDLLLSVANDAPIYLVSFQANILSAIIALKAPVLGLADGFEVESDSLGLRHYFSGDIV